MKKILITGLCGLMGSNLCEHILKNTDWEIIGIDKLNYASNGFDRLRDINAYDDKRVKVLAADLSLPFPMGLHQEIGKVDYVVHLAAETHVDRSLEDSIPFVKSNVLGTAYLLEYIKKYQPNLKKYIGFNTDEVFGPASEGVYHKETDKFYPSNPYSGAKGGQWCMEYVFAHSFGLPIILTHTMNLVSERQHPEKFLPKTIKAIINNEKVILHGVKGTMSSRKWIHARNVADAVLFLLDKGVPEESYNIVGEEKDVLEMANIVCKEIKGRELREDEYEVIDVHSLRKGHDLRYSLDDSKMRGLGWIPPMNLEESLIKTIQWSLKKENQRWLH